VSLPFFSWEICTAEQQNASHSARPGSQFHNQAVEGKQVGDWFLKETAEVRIYVFNFSLTHLPCSLPILKGENGLCGSMKSALPKK
jgi:hypothetical protein